MNWGLSEGNIAKIRAILARHPEVEKAVLYGSRAKGNYRHGSDIDLTLFGEGLDWRKCATIAAELDDSSIPYRVDLSVFALLSHVGLREHIERVGVVLFDRDVWDAEQTAARAARKGAEG